MIEHPWIELQVLIKEKWLTQKAFASILWKKVSEVNELLKWKRNITIQRDYLLHQSLWTPIKYRILKQVDYDYSLIDMNDNSPLLIGEGQGEVSQDTGSSWAVAKDFRWDTNETNAQDSLSQNSSEWQTIQFSPLDKGDSAMTSGFESQKTSSQEQNKEDNEDFKKRARIFKSF